MPLAVGAERLAAISNLLTEFAWGFDFGDGALMASLFEEDGSFTTPGISITGRDELEAWFVTRAGARPARHCWSNLRVTPLDTDRYQVETHVINAFAEGGAGKLSFGSTLDIVLFRDDQARFVSRTLTVMFDGYLSESAPAG